MMKFVRKALTLLLSLAALGLGATQALAADVTYIYSNPITNVRGSSEYIGIGDPSKIKAWASEKDYGIATEVFVCTNPNGKFDHEKSILSQSRLVSTVTYWKLTSDNIIHQRNITDGEIYSTNVPITQRREGTSILAGMKYKYSEANDAFALPEGMPAPTENSAEAFKAWSEDPVNAAYIIDRAVAAACGSTRDKATPSNWNTLYSAVKSKLTKVPKLNLTTFTVKVKDGVLQTGGVEWVVVYSDKILYYEKDAGGNAVRLKMWDCNEMGLADSATGLQAADVGADYADQIEMCERMSNYAALLKSMLGSFKNTALSLPVTGIGSIPEVNGKLQETKSAYERNRLAFVDRIPQEFTEAGDRVIELALDYANLAAWGRSGVAAQAGYIVQIEELFGTTNPQKVRTMVEEFFAKTISGYEDTAAYYLRMAESLTADKKETDAALSEGSGYYAKMVGSFSHYTHPRTMYLESPIFGHSNVLSTKGGKTATNASTGYTYNLYNNDTLINTGGWAITFLDQDCICCDCDAFCPCKFPIDGKKPRENCWCFEENHKNGHPDRLPCDDPIYPKDCLCQTGTVTVTKTDETGKKKLEGAVFTLTNSVTGQVLTGTTDKNGKVTFSKVHITAGNATWRLTETGAPKGYDVNDAIEGSVFTLAAGKTVTFTVKDKQNEDAVEDVNHGKNVIRAWQLTRPFTNVAAWSNTSDFTASNPSVRSCPGFGSSTTYCDKIEIRYCDNLVLKKRGNKNANPPTEDVYVCGGHTETVYHDKSQHRTDYKWGNTVTVYASGFLNSNMFNDNTVIGRYKILHKDNKYLLTFNKTSNYTVNGTSDVYDPLTEVSFVSHRNGALSSQNQEIKLAKYMEKKNKDYIDFYKTYTGNTPNASNSNASNASVYSAGAFSLTTSHGGSSAGSRAFTGYYCRGAVKDESQSGSISKASGH